MILTIFNLFASERTKIRLQSINLYLKVKQSDRLPLALLYCPFLLIAVGIGGTLPAVSYLETNGDKEDKGDKKRLFFDRRTKEQKNVFILFSVLFIFLSLSIPIFIINYKILSLSHSRSYPLFSLSFVLLFFCPKTVSFVSICLPLSL